MLWAFGVGEAPISLAGADGDVLRHTVRRVGAVTTALWAASEGDLIGVRGPFGTGLGPRRRRRAATSSSWPAASAWRRCAR